MCTWRVLQGVVGHKELSSAVAEQKEGWVERVSAGFQKVFKWINRHIMRYYIFT